MHRRSDMLSECSEPVGDEDPLCAARLLFDAIKQATQEP